jgi:uncharacterized protein (TIGR03435 family)
LKESQAATPLLTFQHGKIQLIKQPVAALAKALPNWTKKIVVDETGLKGSYDFDLAYRADGPQVLIDSLHQGYDFVLTPAKRTVKILVIEAL